MNKKILILGAGHVGSAIAIDLKKSGYHVASMDLDKTALRKLSSHGVESINGSFTDTPFLRKHLKSASLVIGASPGCFGFGLMKEVLTARKNMVDISFCPENSLELDELARENKVCLITDMGVAPGMCNLFLGYHNVRMQVESYRCLVGGLPFKREWPLEYKASWSPLDVIEEYTRPARLREHGKTVTKPALSDAELINLDPVGTLEAWNSDGLRSLLYTMPHVPSLTEKTLRYPGTTDYLRVLRELGYFSIEEIDIQGSKVRPVDLTASLLFPKWKLSPGEREFTIMHVEISGNENKKPVKYHYDLYDEYNEKTDTWSMARTTGYACAAAAELLLKGLYFRKGVNPPEYLGENEENYRFIMDYLKKRDVNYSNTVIT